LFECCYQTHKTRDIDLALTQMQGHMVLTFLRWVKLKMEVE
jgi:hypothetical protein